MLQHGNAWDANILTGKNRGGIGNAFGNWMLGGVPSRPRKPAGKDIKKPEVTQRDAVEAECVVL